MGKSTFGKQLETLRKDTKKYDFNKKVEMISLDYFNRNVEDRTLLEYRLKDFIADIDKFSFLSLALFTISPMIRILSIGNECVELIAYIVFYLGLGKLIVELIKKYRFYKLYLEIINDINKGKIIKTCECKDTILFIDKIYF